MNRIQIAPVKFAFAARKGLSIMSNDMFQMSNKSLMNCHIAFNIIQTLLSTSYSFSVDISGYIAHTRIQLRFLVRPCCLCRPISRINPNVVISATNSAE